MLFHPGAIIFQRHGLGGRVGGMWRQSAAVCRFAGLALIFRQAFFQHQTELFQKGLVFSRRLSPVFSICRTRLVRALRRLRVTVLIYGISRETRSTAGH